MKIYIGADHAGYDAKEKLKIFLGDQGYEVTDFGAFTFDPTDDFPDFIKAVAKSVAKENGSKGIVLGGSGFGEAMCANRVHGVRALVFYGPMMAKTAVDLEGRESTDPFETIKLSRMHNDSNVLSLGMRFMTDDQAKEAVMTFLNTPFSNSERHVRRLAKMEQD